MGFFEYCKKLFLTGEVDLLTEMNQGSKKVIIRFGDISKKKLEDIQTDLYIAGVTSTPPQITLKMIKEASYTELSELEDSLPIQKNTTQCQKEYSINVPKKEEFSEHQQTKTKRRENSNPHKEHRKHSAKNDLLYQKKEVCKDIDSAIQKGFEEALKISKMTTFDFEITEKKSGYRFDYISIDFIDPEDEDFFIKKYDFILKRIGKHLNPKKDSRGQKSKRNLYFNSINGKITSSYNGYVLAVEKIESSIMDKRNYYHLLSPNSLEFIVEVNGEPRVFNMAKSPHPLILGTTGAGKSAMQNSMISSFIVKNTKETLSLELISPKLDTDGNDFTQFSNCPLLTAPVLTATGKSMPEFLTEVAIYCERAVQIMRERESKIAKGIAPTSYHILAIDEIVDVVAIQKGSSKEQKENNAIREKIIYLMNVITMKGRSSKVHLFLATQSPRAEYIGAIKSNLNFISLKVSNSIEAKVSGFLEADELLGRGDGFLNIDGEFVRFQSPM